MTYFRAKYLLDSAHSYRESAFFYLTFTLLECVKYMFIKEQSLILNLKMQY